MTPVLRACAVVIILETQNVEKGHLATAVSHGIFSKLAAARKNLEIVPKTAAVKDNFVQCVCVQSGSRPNMQQCSFF